MKIIIEVDTNEDEEVLELIRRLVALLEKEAANKWDNEIIWNIEEWYYEKN